MTAQDNEPISRLDERVQDLVHALGCMPAGHLLDLVAGIRVHEALADGVNTEAPGAPTILAGTEVRRALMNLAVEVLSLRGEET